MPKFEDMVIVTTALTNSIVIGTKDKRMSKGDITVLNDTKHDITKMAVTAVAEHMMQLGEGKCYEWEGKGKLVWVRPDEKVIKRGDAS